MHDNILDEAKRLFRLGAGVHWIKPNSKAPVKAGWSAPARDDWKTVRGDFRKGYGLGVRLGEASKIDGGFLANIDVDIKSDDPRHRKEALAFVRKEFPGLLKSAPIVKTGKGLRLFVKTTEPLRSGKLTSSSETCVVFMPTAEVNKQQLKAVEAGILSESHLKEGWRVRPAWEVEFMSVGKQVVLPPSIHPDTQKPYIWKRELESALSVPLVRLDGMQRRREPGRPQGTHGEKFTAVTVDLVSSQLPDRIVDMILTGEGVEDRSAACFTVAMVMLRARFSDDEILTVLTDRGTFLGETAYDHRKTGSRTQAAAWVRDYCLRKAKEEVDATAAFSDAVTVTPVLDDSGVEAQQDELLGKAGGAHATDWKARLERSGKGPDGAPKPTLKNTLLVLTHAVGEDIFKCDTFSRREFYGRCAPWTGAKCGKAIDDVDAVNIKSWLASKYNFEPSVGIVFEAMTAIASKNAFHPVRDELEALPPWDSVPRIDTWLRRGFNAKGPDEFLAQVMRKWMVASVTRTYQPGAKFDWMPIFEGKQGIGKSAFGTLLFGQKYFADWLPVLSDKDAALGLEGKRCVEFGELESMRRNEIETTKAFVTRQVDNVRPPYGRKQVEIYRQCVFFGTTNKETYFKDDSGNRRFVPVEVQKLDFELLIAERDQLWAEALFIYRNGLEPSLYLDSSADEHARKAQQTKMVEDQSSFMAERLEQFIEKEKTKPIEERFDFYKFKMLSLFDGMGPWAVYSGGGRDDRNIYYGAKALKIIGAEKRTIRGKTWWKIDFDRDHPHHSPTTKKSKILV